MSSIDLNYYINVYDLMMLDLPRPRLKRTIIVNDGEFLPLIDGSTGEILRWFKNELFSDCYMVDNTHNIIIIEFVWFVCIIQLVSWTRCDNMTKVSEKDGIIQVVDDGFHFQEFKRDNLDDLNSLADLLMEELEMNRISRNNGLINTGRWRRKWIKLRIL